MPVCIVTYLGVSEKCPWANNHSSAFSSSPFNQSINVTICLCFFFICPHLSVCISVCMPMSVCIVTYLFVSVPDSEKCPWAKNHSSAFPSSTFNRLVYCVHSILEFSRCFTLTFEISLFAIIRLAANTSHVSLIEFWNLPHVLLLYMKYPMLINQSSLPRTFLTVTTKRANKQKWLTWHKNPRV